MKMFKEGIGCGRDWATTVFSMVERKKETPASSIILYSRDFYSTGPDLRD